MTKPLPLKSFEHDPGFAYLSHLAATSDYLNRPIRAYHIARLEVHENRAKFSLDNKTHSL
jgi:hypothetical protein